MKLKTCAISRAIARIGREIGQVGIDAGGDGMVVAGAEMDVVAQLAVLASHDQRHLGVGLQLDEAEDDLNAGALQVARPADVGLLVEARLELDQRRDRLARLGGIDQRANDRAVVGGAVERLLDGHDLGIDRRLAQELHHHVEGFVGMVHDDVLFADRREAIAAVVADALGKAGIVGRELEVVARQRHDLGYLVDRQRSSEHADAR